MSETPAPAPALTDEQIEDLRIEIVETDDGLALRQARLTRYTAAVIARAKREEREWIDAQTIYVVQEWVETDGIHDGWNTAYGYFTNSREDAERTLGHLRKTYRDTEFRLVTATRSNWKGATDETR